MMIKCEDCQYFKAYRAKGLTYAGQCRLYPPKVDPKDLPEVRLDSGCGQGLKVGAEKPTDIDWWWKDHMMPPSTPKPYQPLEPYNPIFISPRCTRCNVELLDTTIPCVCGTWNTTTEITGNHD